MGSNKVIIDGVNVAECSLYNNGKCLNLWNSETKEYDKCNSYCDFGAYARQEQLQRAKAENEKLNIKIEKIKHRFNLTKKANKQYKKEIENLHKRMSDVIYRATGGRLSYSTYTLDAIEQAFQDQLEILSDRKAEDEIEQYKKSKQASYETMQAEWNNAVNELRDVKEENEKLKKDIHNIYENCKYCDEFYMDKCNYIKKENKYKQALEEIREIVKCGCASECYCQCCETIEKLIKETENE